MTPREFGLLTDRLKDARRHALYCAAVGASATYNTARSSKDDPIMTPEKMLGEEKKASPAQKWQDMKLMVQHFYNPALGGKDLTKNG